MTWMTQLLSQQEEADRVAEVMCRIQRQLSAARDSLLLAEQAKKKPSHRSELGFFTA